MHPFDLAPGGVYRATPVTWGAGGLLHHRFTLTSRTGEVRSTSLGCGAVCFLWHCPAGHPGWALPTTALYGVRTFLSYAPFRGRNRDRLAGSSIFILVFARAVALWALSSSVAGRFLLLDSFVQTVPRDPPTLANLA